jgi:hypothetical protein
MTVNRNATAAGKKFESDLVKFLRVENGLDAERLHLSGAEDEGDILLRASDQTRFVIEAKRTKGFFLADWVKQAQTERDNYVVHRGITHTGTGFVVVHYARGKGISQSYVTTTLEEWLKRL